mmetsp:Transcript_8199/g.20312  ORF Transcript_8199/g.20312 Transcript_8199/m.20312 type:complete len:249 (-) Transcript_8199:2161-2907(-)
MWPARELAVGDHRVTVVRGPEESHHRGSQEVDKVLVFRVPKDKYSDRRKSHVQTNDHVPEKDPVRDEGIVLSTRRLEHDVGVGRVETEGGGGGTVRNEVDPEQLHGNKSLRASNGRGQKDGKDLSNVGRNHVSDERLHVGVDGSSLFDGRNNRRKVVVGQDHVRGLLGDLRSGNSHGNPDRGLLEGGSIVDSISGHGGDFSTRSKNLHQQLLVPGFSSGKDPGTTSLHDQAGSLLVADGSLEELGTGE